MDENPGGSHIFPGMMFTPASFPEINKRKHTIYYFLTEFLPSIDRKI